MKKHILFSVIFLHIFNLGISQNEKSLAVAAGAIGAIGAIASYANSIKQYEESLELMVTEHILTERNDVNKFILKNLSLSKTIARDDQSNNNYIPFGLSVYKEIGVGPRELVLLNLSKGWVNQSGVDYSKVSVHYFTREDVFKLLLSYINLAAPVNIAGEGFEIPIVKPKLKKKDVEADFSKVQKSNGVVFYVSNSTYYLADLVFTRKGLDYNYSRGGRNYSESLMNFRRFDDDFYSVANFNEEFKLVYNENSLGLFNIENGELTKINRSMLNTILKFFTIN